MSFIVKAPSVLGGADLEGWIDDILALPASHDPHFSRHDSLFGLPRSPSNFSSQSPAKPPPGGSLQNAPVIPSTSPYETRTRRGQSKLKAVEPKLPAKKQMTVEQPREPEIVSQERKSQQALLLSQELEMTTTLTPPLAGGLGFPSKAEGVEEIRFRNPQSHEEFSVFTEFKPDDPLSLKSVSSFSAAYPNADPKATHGYYGNVEIVIGFDEALKKGKKNCDYSSIMNKLFVDINHVFPLTFQLRDPSLKSFPPGTVIRATPVFIEGEHRDADVKICPVHKVPGGPEHIIRCKNKDTRYVDETGEHSRYSLTFPFTGKKTTEHFQFLCYSSCHELKRRRMEVLFTLEVGGRAVGRASFEAKICSYPVRDRTSEEGKIPSEKGKGAGGKKDGKGGADKKGQKKGAKGKAKQSTDDEASAEEEEEDQKTSEEVSAEANNLPLVPSLKRSGSLVTNPPPSSEGGDPNRIYNIKVQGYENYRIVTKILQGLDALKALGQELNASSMAAMSGSSPQKRVAGDDSPDLPNKRLRFTPNEGSSGSGESEGDAMERRVALLTDDQKKVASWLNELGLIRYLGHFIDAEFADVHLIKELNSSDLDSLNIQLPGHRKKLLLASKTLKRTLDGPGGAAPIVGGSSGVALSSEMQVSTEQGIAAANTQEGDVTVEQIEEFQKRTIMRRYHSGMQ